MPKFYCHIFLTFQYKLIEKSYYGQKREAIYLLYLFFWLVNCLFQKVLHIVNDFYFLQTEKSCLGHKM